MKIRLCTVLALVGVLVAGCGASQDRDRLTVALVAGNMSDPFWQTFRCGATKRAAALGVELKAYVSPTASARDLAMSFDSALLAKPDALTYSPFTAGQFSGRVRRLMRQGIPVATSYPLDPDTGFIAVGSADHTGPYTDFAVRLATASGKVAVMGGIAGSPALQERYEPLLAAIRRESPRVRVLPTQYTYFDVNRTAQIASALMLAHPDLRLIIASTGPEGQGVAAAVKQAGKQGRVKVLAFDAVPAEVQAVRDGAIQGLIAQAPERIGAEQVSELVRYLRSHPRGGPVTPRPARRLPLRLITADNVDDPALRPWLYTTSCETP